MTIRVIGLLLMASSAYAGSLYTITPIGPATENVQVSAISDSGFITGTAGDYAFISYQGAFASLGSLGGSNSSGLGVNDSGEVVGMSYPANNNAVRAFAYTSGPMLDLGSLGGRDSEAAAVNDNGAIAGWSDTTGTTQNHAFLYENGSMLDLGTLGGDTSEALAINNSGEVVGDARTSSGLYHAFLYDGKVMQDLGTLSGGLSRAFGINDSGQVVGDASVTLPSGVSVNHAFLDSGGQMVDIGGLGGNATADDINNFGVVVGGSDTSPDPYTGEQHAFIFSDGVMSDLNNLIPANSGWVLADAVSINDSGQIVGVGYSNAGYTAFLLTPVETPLPQAAWSGATLLLLIGFTRAYISKVV